MMTPPFYMGRVPRPLRNKGWVSGKQGVAGPAGAGGESDAQAGFSAGAEQTGVSACGLGIWYWFSAGVSEEQKTQLTLCLFPILYKRNAVFSLA